MIFVWLGRTIYDFPMIAKTHKSILPSVKTVFYTWCCNETMCCLFPETSRSVFLKDSHELTKVILSWKVRKSFHKVQFVAIKWCQYTVMLSEKQKKINSADVLMCFGCSVVIVFQLNSPLFFRHKNIRTAWVYYTECNEILCTQSFLFGLRSENFLI